MELSHPWCKCPSPGFFSSQISEQFADSRQIRSKYLVAPVPIRRAYTAGTRWLHLRRNVPKCPRVEIALCHGPAENLLVNKGGRLAEPAQEPGNVLDLLVPEWVWK